ncbi:MAG: electron transport complex subunit E [Deltaproteobacteria bacterium]|nr:electron transport complex subunit E [Deltaproteobacteria bacterium]
MTLWQEFSKGIVRENPVLKILLGFCPTLAVTTLVINALGMGAATTFVLVSSNLAIALVARFIPENVRIPCYIVIIATFVTVVELLIQAFSPALNAALGIYIPLIVVNCIILGRAEAFASKNPVLPSILDGLGMGLGFTFALVILASIREIFGNGTWLGFNVIGIEGFSPILFFALPPGAFLGLGLLIALVSAYQRKR